MFKRKFRRSFKKRYNKKRRFGKKRSMKIFKRKFNACGEKKMNQVTNYGPLSILSSVDASAQPNTRSCIYASIPALGTGVSNRIGNKIFVRYLKLTLTITSTEENYTTGKIGLFFGQEKKPQVQSTLSNAEHFFGGGPMLSRLLFKETYRKASLKLLNIQSINAVAAGIVESNVPYQYVLRKKIRVMKEVTLDREGKPNLPDYVWRCYGFIGITSNTGTGHNQTLSTTITYTDI